MGILDELEHLVQDKQKGAPTIPLKLLHRLAITVKMKVKTSLTGMPFAIEDTELLHQMGYNLVNTGGSEENALMSEGEYRFVIGKYDENEFLSGYNAWVQKNMLPKAGINCNIPLLDCTRICVNLKNTNYEGATIVKDEEGTKRGYQWGTLRGIAADGGVIEEICFGAISEQYVSLCRDMIFTGSVLKPGDMLINERGFLSRDILNEVKTNCGVDT